MILIKIKPLAKRLTVSALSLSLIIQNPISVPIAKAEPVSAINRMSDAPENKLSLWYRQPAINWETDALPIGNGLMGGMIFGGIEQERIQLNEKTLWSGGPGSSLYILGLPRMNQQLLTRIHSVIARVVKII